MKPAICSNCMAYMPDTGHRACATCRAEWRMRARAPGGPAEQKEALVELIAAAENVTRILEAVRYRSGLGQGQISRLTKAQATIAKAKGVIRS